MLKHVIFLLSICFFSIDAQAKNEGSVSLFDEELEKKEVSKPKDKQESFLSFMNFEMPEAGDAIINVTNYIGTVITVSMDGKEVGTIAYSPYDLLVNDVSAGTHCLKFTLYGNRHNSFGELHLADDGFIWHGPEAWQRNLRGRHFETANEFVDFKYEDSFKPVGIMASPEIKILK